MVGFEPSTVSVGTGASSGLLPEDDRASGEGGWNIGGWVKPGARVWGVIWEGVWRLVEDIGQFGESEINSGRSFQDLFLGTS